ncbi:c-type cytochrome [Antarctobacter jejuensis]|uniref:c-type cytochrome n=1 Tax=Antarctobacter jejuensis TaxID=1439938 RepID=UPI003FD39271
MKFRSILATALILAGASTVQAQENEVVLGKTAFGALCAVCHGEDGKGGGEIAELFKIPPADLTKLSENEGGQFPFVRVYNTLARGMGKAGHGEAEMPVWGDYFVADSLADRGVKPGDAIAIASGRILAVTMFLSTIQE